MDLINRKQCSLCLRNDPQVSLILSSLQQKLHKLLKKSQIQDKLNKQNQKNCHGFYRVIRVVYSNKFKHLKANIHCRHDQVKKYLMKKLKCSNETFNFLCDELADILGKFNFHIDTLVQQIKGFQRYLKCDKSQSNTNVADLKQQKQEIFEKTSDQFQNFDRKDEQDQIKVKQEQKQLNFGPQIPTVTSYSQMQMNLAANQFIFPLNYFWYYDQK